MKSQFAIFSTLILFIIGCHSKTTEPGETAPIRISSPQNGDTLEEPVYIVAVAGTDYTFSRVDFYIDGDSVWSDNAPPYQYYWNVFVYTGSTEHTLEAVGHATDSTYTSDPVEVTVLIVPGFAFLSAYAPNTGVVYGVTSYQNALFVATGDPGLEVIDMTDKGAPRYRSRYDSFGQAVKAAVQYPYIYIADGDPGALRVDFSDVDSLILEGTYNTPGLATDVAVSGDYLYVADLDNLAIADISVPDTLIPINNVSLTGGTVNYVVARGDTAFVTDVENFYIIDLTNPSLPDILSTSQTSGNAQGIAVMDSFAFVADGVEGVKAYSISNPHNPRFVARYAVDQGASTLDVGDSTLFVGTFVGDVYALDYSQPDTLVLVDRFDTANLIWQVHSAPPYVYVATNSNVNILRFLR
jgi:hypothetical protein